MDETGAFPPSWTDWRLVWDGWLAEQIDAGRMVRKTHRFPSKNFMADEILGVWRIGSRVVELSEVTFIPGGVTSRYVGVTYAGDGGTTVVPEPTGLASSFAELESILTRDCGVSFASGTATLHDCNGAEECWC